MSWYDIEDEFDTPNYVAHGRKAGHPLGHGAPHIPNKQEGKELRRLMQKSGETEEQVRSNIDNRRKLAAAAKSPQMAGNRYRIVFIRTRRRIAQEMNLPAYDNRVHDATVAAMIERSRRYYGRYW